jgi:hypothetical protein
MAARGGAEQRLKGASESFHSAGPEHPTISPRRLCSLHPMTAVTSRERNYLWMAASHKYRPLIGEGARHQPLFFRICGLV